MVSNKQEKEESICGTCEKELKSSHNGLQGYLCDRWFHCGCEKVSAEDYKLLSREENGAQWYCKTCRGQVRNMKDENRKLRSENKNLVMENETLKNCLSKLEKKIEDLNEDIKQEVVEDVKRVVIETMKEENEKRESQSIWSCMESRNLHRKFHKKGKRKMKTSVSYHS